MKIPPRLVSGIVYYIYKIWFFTLRYTNIGRERAEKLNAEGRPIIICLWHDELFATPGSFGKVKVVPVISASNDGEILTNVFKRFGVESVRGSSSRGGAAALHGAVNAMKKGFVPSITVDGPRGPRRKIKSGVFFLAYHGDALLIPVRILNKRVKRLNSWDKFQLPLPFSTGKVVWGEPYAMNETELDKSAISRQKKILAQKMDDLEKEYGFQ